MRNDYEEYASLSDYRNDFLEVVSELLHNKDNIKVVGTFDHQIYSWWVSFAKGSSFVPDPFFTVVSDREIEYRLGVFCKLLGMNSKEFRAFITRPYINHFWLAHNKYKVSKNYTFSPLSNYDSDNIQKKVQEAGILGGQLMIPNNEQERLTKQFNALGEEPEPLRLDVIILTNDEFLKSFHPSSETFELSYENSTFRIWKRKTRMNYNNLP